jgi:SAM-dependent methyltransferase
VKGRILGIAYEDDELEYANKLKSRYLKKYQLNKVDFIKGSILNLTESGKIFDQALCIDVIEHIEDDMVALEQLSDVIKPGGHLILSTITREYPKYFGYEFHEKIGHVRQGYTLDELEKLLRTTGFEIINATYHSKLIGKIIGILYYKKGYLRGHPLLRLALHPFVTLLGLVDPYLPARKPLGIAIKARKMN